MKTVFPFGNTVAIVKITGAQLLELLEASTCSTPLAIGAFPQVSGIEFTIDTTVPYINGEQYPDSTYYAPVNPGARIKNVMVNGKALELEKTYNMATNDFHAAGGDTYYLLKNLSSYNTGVALEDALINYTSEVLNGVISKKMYGASEGRITILTESAADKAETKEDNEDYKEHPEVIKKETGTKDETGEPQGKAEKKYIYYTVVKGDSLWKIARKYLGSGARYMEIYEFNRDIIKSPDRIYIGQVLKIPALYID